MLRLNKHLAATTGISRRKADELIARGLVTINGSPAQIGQVVDSTDTITVKGEQVEKQTIMRTIMLNKPVGYVCSRDGQGSQTVYDLLPEELHALKPIGRLDKDSSGLLLLTEDGNLAHTLTHPSFRKKKTYQISLHKPLSSRHERTISREGVPLEDGLSRLLLKHGDSTRTQWTVVMEEGRNRQIRRTFATLNYSLNTLHRTKFGPYELGPTAIGQWSELKPKPVNKN